MQKRTIVRVEGSRSFDVVFYGLTPREVARVGLAALAPSIARVLPGEDDVTWSILETPTYEAAAVTRVQTERTFNPWDGY